MSTRSHVAWLFRELACLVDDGIITEEQSQLIKGRYRAAETRTFISIIAILGALLLGLGTILVLAFNWHSIPEAVRLGIVVSAMAVSYASGYWLAFESRRYVATGRALILLGVLLFGAGIWTIVQIYNISFGYSYALLIWAAAALLVSVVLAEQPVLWLSQVLFLAWVFTWQGENDYAMNYWFPVVMAIGVLPAVIRLRSTVAAPIWVVGFASWLGRTYSHPIVFARFPPNMLAVQTFLLLLYEATSIDAVSLNRAKVGTTFRTVSLAGVLVTVFAFTTAYGESCRLPSLEPLWTVLPMELTIFMGAMATSCLALGICGIRRSWRHARWRSVEHVAAVSLLIITTLQFAAPGMMPVWAWTVMVNVVYFALALGVLWMGTLDGNPVMVTMAVGFFLLGIVARFFDYALAAEWRSLSFIAGGAVLLISAWLLERGRRAMLQRAKAVRKDDQN